VVTVTSVRRRSLAIRACGPRVVARYAGIKFRCDSLSNGCRFGKHGIERISLLRLM